MVADSRKRTRALEQFIVFHMEIPKSLFEVSDVKRDGTVFVKFRSSDFAPAMTLTENFGEALRYANKDFVQTDDNKIRLALEQFGGSNEG
jgi:hypothetical protein